jgi:hypothetical protein
MGGLSCITCVATLRSLRLADEQLAWLTIRPAKKHAPTASTNSNLAWARL